MVVTLNTPVRQRRSCRPFIGALILATAPTTRSVREGPLGRKTAGGFVFVAAQLGIGKLVAFGTQIVLARWLLEPSDFGTVGLAYAFTAIVGLLQQVGLREILV